MTDDTAEKGRSGDTIRTAKSAADTAKTLVEGTSNAVNMVKWVAIAIVGLVVLGGGFLVYTVMSAPVKAVGNASKAVTESMKSGAVTVKDGTSDVLNRLVIPTADQTSFNISAEAAFEVLTTHPASEPEGLKENLFWKANFPGHENRVCDMSLDFGGTAIPVLVAVDNKAYAPSKTLGSNKNRLMRFMLRAPNDDIVIHVAWEDETEHWVSKWRATTVKKPLEDDVAAARVMDVLTASAEKCGE